MIFLQFSKLECAIYVVMHIGFFRKPVRTAICEKCGIFFVKSKGAAQKLKIKTARFLIFLIFLGLWGPKPTWAHGFYLFFGLLDGYIE